MFLRTDEMKKYLEDRDMLHGLATQIHVNHDDCPAGVDTKARLYIKRAPDGVMFYCHHCGSKGYYRLKDVLYRASEIVSLEDAVKETDYGTLLDELSAGVYYKPLAEWSPEARLWWASYGFTEEDAQAFDVQFYADRVWLCTEGGKLFQGRGFHNPKYITLGDKDTCIYYVNSVSNKYIVVEDLLSTYKVYKAGGNAVCLLGTTLNNKTKSFLATRALGITIWLDDDEAGWKASTAIYKELHGLVDNVVTIRDRQPKEHGLEFIRGVFDA